MRKGILFIVTICMFGLLSGCGTSVVNDTTTEATTENTTEKAVVTTEATTRSTNRSTTRATTETTTEKSYEHICEASGCTKEGTKSIVGISGVTEYYCLQHYNEIQSMIGDMEKDVGESSTSKHQCEASGCTKEGTNSLVGFGGTTEYYCTQHYNEIVDMLNKMYEE